MPRFPNLVVALAVLLIAASGCGGSSSDNPATKPKPPSHTKIVANVNRICGYFSSFVKSAPVNAKNVDMGEVFSQWADASKKMVDKLKAVETGAADRGALTRMIAAASAMRADMRMVASKFKEQDKVGYQSAFTKWQTNDLGFEAAAGQLGAQRCRTQ